MRIILVVLVLLAGCNTHRETSSDEEAKQVNWCVGACLFGQHTSRKKDTKADIASEEEDEDE